MAENKRMSMGMNAIYKMILNVFNLLVPLLVGPYIAGLLNEELYGVYNRVVAEFNIFFVLGAFGIYNYGVREISKVRENKKKREEVFSSLFIIGLVSNIIVTLFYIIYFNIRGNGLDKYVYAVMIIQMMSNVFYIEFMNEAAENYAFITKKTILVRLLYFVAIFAFVKKPTDIVIYSIVVSMTVLLNNFISFVYLKRQYRFTTENLEIKKHMAPLVVSLLLANVELLYSQLDKIMLSPFVNDIAVTEYTLPTTLVGMVCTIPLALISVAIPRLASYIGEGNLDTYKKTLTDTIRTYMSILIPMIFGIFVLAQEIMWLYTKDVYTYVYPVLALAAVSRIVHGYESIVTNLMMYVCGFEKKLTMYLLYGGVINVFFNVGLVACGKFNAFNAFLTTTLAYLLVTILCKRHFEKKMGMKVQFLDKKIWQYIGVSALFIPVTIVVKLLGLGYWFNIIAIIIVCVAIYGVFLLVTKDPLVDVVFNILRRKK